MLKKLVLAYMGITQLINVNFMLMAAGPIMHVYLAEKWLERYGKSFTEDDKRKFIVGTLFPDIRYLGVLTREQTHETGLTLYDIQACPNRWEAGKKLHCFVDEVRAHFADQSAIYSILHQTVPEEHSGTLLKLIEDAFVQSRINVASACSYLSTIEPEEEATGVKLEALKQWHNQQAGHMKSIPHDVIKRLSEQQKGYLTISSQLIQIWAKELPALLNNKHITTYAEKLVAHFDEQLANNAQQSLTCSFVEPR